MSTWNITFTKNIKLNDQEVKKGTKSQVFIIDYKRECISVLALEKPISSSRFINLLLDRIIILNHF